MKRVKTVSATSSNGTKIDIKISVDTQSMQLTREEAEHVISSLASDAMRMITSVPYSRIELSDVKVS